MANKYIIIQGVYSIRNNVDNKMYIGGSKNINQRFSWHLSALKGGYSKNKYLQDAFDQHGRDALSLEIIEECDLKDLAERESYWIKFYNTRDRSYGYNLYDPQDPKMPQECKDNLREKLIGNTNAVGAKRSDEFKRNLSRIKTGNVMSEETKAKLKDVFFPKGHKPWNKGITWKRRKRVKWLTN